MVVQFFILMCLFVSTRAATFPALDDLAFDSPDFSGLTCTNFTDPASTSAGCGVIGGEALCSEVFGANSEGCIITIDNADPQFDGLFPFLSVGTGAAGIIGISDDLGALEPNDDPLNFAPDTVLAGNGADGVAGFLLPDGAILANATGFIDSRVNYKFSVDVCASNVTTTGTVTFKVALGTSNEALIVTPAISNDFLVGSAGTSPITVGDNREATVEFATLGLTGACETLEVEFRHYELFDHVGQEGFQVQVDFDGTDGAVFFDNFAIEQDNIIGDAGNILSCTKIFINEIDFLVVDADTEEMEEPELSTNAIEIAGPAGFSLEGYQIILFDGQTGSSYIAGQFLAAQQFPDNEGQIGLLTITFAEGLMNAENNIADGIAILDDDGELVQFLCYGMNGTATFVEDAATLTRADGTTLTATCTHVADVSGFFLDDDEMPQDQSLSLRGCGECAEDFDFQVAARSHNADADVGQPGNAEIDGMNDGEANPDQFFCTDLDLDGYWPAASIFAPDQVGITGTGNANDACVCGGNDCQPRYSHVFPSEAPDETCDGMVTNCQGTDADLATEEMDMDLDGRLPCSGDCDDWKDTKFGDAVNADGAVVDNVYYPDPTNAFNITLGGQCPDGVIGGVAAAVLSECTDCTEGLFTLDTSANEDVCDGRDNNCDGQIDDPFLPFIAHYPDNDMDGFGDENVLVDGETNLNMLANCFVSETGRPEDRTYPMFWAPNALDCDDTSADVNPGIVIDSCNATLTASAGFAGDVGIDNNCDGRIDEDILEDFDGDTFPDQNCTFAPLDAPSAAPSDCNDTNPFVHPGAEEICDGFDNDCDSSNDEIEGDPQERFDDDRDGDLFIRCDPSTTEAGVAINLDGFVTGGVEVFDCNDTNANTNPGMVGLDICDDGQDSDCDGEIDEDQIIDFDGDNHPNVTCPTSSIDIFRNEVDCNDMDDTVFPDAQELCDGVLNNCTALILPADEDDVDMDGFFECTPEPGTVVKNLAGGDCNDNDFDIKPNATDFYLDCDGVDNNCDGNIDEQRELNEASQVLADIDGDNSPNFLCATTSEDFLFEINVLDCDDTDNSIFPGAIELCDGIDQNCDGELVFINNLGLEQSENDTDEDGFLECNGDCGEGDPAIHPEADDFCEAPCGVDGTFTGTPVCTGDCTTTTNTRGVDNNCDGVADNQFLDADGDDFPDHLCLSSEDPFYNGENGGGCTDCDDNEVRSAPNLEEICDGINNSCQEEFPANEVDDDGDGFPKCNDCDDSDMNVNPAAVEVCDAENVIDRNCDGELNNIFVDEDNDGYPLITCPSATGVAGQEADCNDNDPSIRPGAKEECNGHDDNCDGIIPDDEIDHDFDGFLECNGDCLPNNKNANPGIALDFCDGIDNNCNDKTDEDFVDNDNDFSPQEQCLTAPEGSVGRNAADCDDNDPSNSPLNNEIDFPGDDGFGDYKDNNCNKQIDEGLPRLVGKVDVKLVKQQYESSGGNPHAVVILALKNIGDGEATGVVTKGKIHLPKHARFVEKVFGGDAFSVRIDSEGNFMWSQNQVNAGATQSVKIDVALARAEDKTHIHVIAQLTEVTGFTPTVIFTV